MNARFSCNPEIIASVRKIDSNGDETYVGDKVVGISIIKSANDTGLINVDVRNFQGRTSLILDIELSELLLALGQAALNPT